MLGQNYIKPIIDLTAGYAFFDGLLIKCGSLKYLDLDSTCPVIPEEQIFVCRQMTESILALQSARGKGLSVLDIGTGSGVLGIYAERLLNRSGGEISTVYGLDCSKLALETAQDNAKSNQCQAIQFLEKQLYNVNSVAPESQDIILMNPPFNPTYPGLLDKVALLGSTDDFCLGKFREWIDIAATHIRSDGLIIGCTMSPVRNGRVVAIEDLTKVLGSRIDVRYAYINDGIYETKRFLEKQYANYAALISVEDQQELSSWISTVSTSYQHLAFIYFEASKTGQSGEVVLEVDVKLKQYDPSWEHRIFLQSSLLLHFIKNMDDSLAKINFAEAEDTIRTVHNPETSEEILSRTVISPLAQYISSKINFYYALNTYKYLNEYIKGSLFCELALFCPDDIDSPQKLFSFSLMLPQANSSALDEEDINFFNNYYTILNFLYREKSSVFFAPNFFRAQRSDQWLPKINDVVEDSYSVLSKAEDLISFSDEIQEYHNLDFDCKSSSLEKKLPIFRFKQESSHNIYFCFNSGYVKEKWDAINQTKDVPDVSQEAHYCFHNLNRFGNATFMVVVPIYTQDATRGGYTVTGGFMLFGELSDLVSIENRGEMRRMLRNLSLDIKQDLTPVIAGYAYHRSGDKRFYDSLDEITYELQGFWSLIRPEFPPELLPIIQDICTLQSSAYENENIEDVATDYLKSFIYKPLQPFKTFHLLINYLFSASILFNIGKDGTVSNLLLTSDEIRAKIDSEENGFRETILEVTYIPNELKDALIINPKNFTVSTKLILTALNNMFGKVNIKNNQKVTILIEKNRIRLINNYNPNSPRGKRNRSYYILRRLCSLLQSDSLQDLIFNPINFTDLQEQEHTLWNDYFQNAGNSLEFTGLWLTQIPISLELDI